MGMWGIIYMLVYKHKHHLLPHIKSNDGYSASSLLCGRSRPSLHLMFTHRKDNGQSDAS